MPPKGWKKDKAKIKTERAKKARADAAAKKKAEAEAKKKTKEVFTGHVLFPPRRDNEPVRVTKETALADAKAAGLEVDLGNRQEAPPVIVRNNNWWGNGVAPWLLYPLLLDRDVTIKIEAEWSEERNRWESHGGKYYFDQQAADDACAFFPECLTHSKGEFAGKPFTLEPWEEFLIIRPVFGWKHASSGFRRFRKVYIEIPKKNGKSKFCAGLGVYMTFCDGEPGAEIMCAAADREQAGIVFDEAKAMVEDCEALLERARVYRRSIVYEETRSSFKVLSADARTKHGPNIQCLIFDELHAQPDRTLFETLEKGIAARRQPLIVMITTAGDDTESICYEQHDYAESVIKEGGDESFLPVMFNLPREANWQDLEVLRTVNPSLGVTVKEDYLMNEIQSAIKDTRKQNALKQLHGNVWTQQHRLWIPIENWDKCKSEIDEALLVGRLVAGGLDLSSKTDLSSFVLAFKHWDNDPSDPYSRITTKPEDTPEIILVDEKPQPLKDEKKPAKKFKINFSVTFIPFFWMPEASLTERKQKDRFAYDLMKDQNLIELTEGEIIDYDAIYDRILELAPVYKLKGGEIGYDPWNATQLSTQLSKDGFQMIEIPQTMNHLSEASKVYEALVLAGRVRHSGHRVLRWNVENVAVKEDTSGNIKPVKPSKMKRIDGVVASILALSRLLTLKKKPAPSALWV